MARQFPAAPEIPQGEFISPEELDKKGSRGAQAPWDGLPETSQIDLFAMLGG